MSLFLFLKLFSRPFPLSPLFPASVLLCDISLFSFSPSAQRENCRKSFFLFPSISISHSFVALRLLLLHLRSGGQAWDSEAGRGDLREREKPTSQPCEGAKRSIKKPGCEMNVAASELDPHNNLERVFTDSTVSSVQLLLDGPG